MSNTPGLLARLFSRRPAARGGWLAEVYTRAINRPLLVAPDFGVQTLRGWLDMQGDVEPSERDLIDSEGGIAVIEISGPLVSRPSGWCSPLSYSEIAAAFAGALADGNVSAIVLRIDSGGGEASGCFDLADMIHAARGQKPMTAVIDDRACSAAYAIASACDEIVLSRTACVGSVGVVAYHEDRSGADRMAGVVVEYVYAGAHKIDGNPHGPLTDQARAAVQAEVGRLYEMFVEAVARNRGLSVEAVQATEAGVYFGADAVAAGLADRVGTLADVLAGLPERIAAAAVMPDAEMQPDAAVVQASVADAAADSLPEIIAGAVEQTSGPAEIAEAAAAILDACAAAGVPTLAAEHLRAGRTLAEVQALLSEAEEIRIACAAAGMPDIAAEYIGKQTPLAVVRRQLIDARAEEGPTQIHSHVLPVQAAAGGKRLRPAADYFAARRATIEGLKQK